ncbi:hypothetical protein [Legionella spiritensis]|uniref:Hydroxylaminobenzene mutase HabB n=1 Tax=Legionella spiritensis TaxID=452 RepID=A0A0W0YWD6_LEGSP|nr:hypothetical protein [Legionella spiritensis]KTD61156.1 Hydroxylaminobenzene mutase HabB [Legionella spiritensis]SNV45263.1 Uncharacterised protein [Legionella spiritensis]
MATVTESPLNRKLLWFGVLLFLLGLITGFATPFMKNPRMGLSSHLEGLMNGMFLILLGIIWPHLRLTGRILGWTGTLALFAAYTNWAATLLAGIWGAGADMMPLAGGDYHGLPWQEILIKFGLISLSVAIVTVCGILLWGLRGKAPQR